MSNLNNDPIKDVERIALQLCAFDFQVYNEDEEKNNPVEPIAEDDNDENDENSGEETDDDILDLEEVNYSIGLEVELEEEEQEEEEQEEQQEENEEENYEEEFVTDSSSRSSSDSSSSEENDDDDKPGALMVGQINGKNFITIHVKKLGGCKPKFVTEDMIEFVAGKGTNVGDKPEKSQDNTPKEGTPEREQGSSHEEEEDEEMTDPPINRVGVVVVREQQDIEEVEMAEAVQVLLGPGDLPDTDSDDDTYEPPILSPPQATPSASNENLMNMGRGPMRPGINGVLVTSVEPELEEITGVRMITRSQSAAAIMTQQHAQTYRTRRNPTQPSTSVALMEDSDETTPSSGSTPSGSTPSGLTPSESSEYLTASEGMTWSTASENTPMQKSQSTSSVSGEQQPTQQTTSMEDDSSSKQDDGMCAILPIGPDDDIM